ncbi:hypothetical protein C8P64_1296 [Christiangramia gaetbulicola]|uniref:Uncharacterized protein n=1 Tax=Christiangramia gaetbulicola TaxID=703340 RepID=A0A2T6AN99_9FLAO|nr:hypothetical protein C8P64_1296 [Christiangramia gaetbulicola]
MRDSAVVSFRRSETTEKSDLKRFLDYARNDKGNITLSAVEMCYPETMLRQAQHDQPIFDVTLNLLPGI